MTQAILLPGGVRPAELAYAGLVEALGDEVDARLKELELYAEDRPPDGYSLDTEVDGILRFAEEAGFERFHLVGYSAGGAASLAFAATHPGRPLSLSLLEPAWDGREGLSDEEAKLWREYERIMSLPPEEMMLAFARVQLDPRAILPEPPPGPQPPWMAKRPPGLAALTRSFKTYDLDRDALRGFQAPVYFALGELSSPVQYRRMADRLAGVFPDFTLEVFEGRHHFDPPSRAEPERLAESLRRHWARAERG